MKRFTFVIPVLLGVIAVISLMNALRAEVVSLKPDTVNMVHVLRVMKVKADMDKARILELEQTISKIKELDSELAIGSTIGQLRSSLMEMAEKLKVIEEAATAKEVETLHATLRTVQERLAQLESYQHTVEQEAGDLLKVV